MGAQILQFPSKSAHHQAAALHLAPVITERWQAEHVPTIGVAVELLELDDRDLAARVDSMRDADGAMLLLNLLEALRSTSGEIENILRALLLGRSRISAAIAASLRNEGNQT